MRFLFASDSFKGSLTSAQTVELLTRAAKTVFGEAVECRGIPVADGGEGTVEALIEALHGTRVSAEVCGPLGTPVTARYGRLTQNCAVLEMAAASGLPLVPLEQRDPLRTTSRGTGELLRHALDAGCTELVLAIGGSATNDGGTGCLEALGVRFMDRNGRALPGCGASLENICEIDVSGLEPRWKPEMLRVLCDVNNPLCGPNGATLTYGAQKGGTPETLTRLEAGMQNYRDVLRRQFGVDPDAIPGAGAAGGLGAALTVLLGGTLCSGIGTVLELLKFDRLLDGVDLVITGEGRADWQSCCGKVVQGVGERARAKGIPVIALCGSLGPGAEHLYDHGITVVQTVTDASIPPEEALRRAPELYEQAALRMFSELKNRPIG